MSHFFSTNLKLLRKRRNLTQDDVAQAISLKRPTYSGYENGVAQPEFSILMQISRFYNIAVDTLLGVDLAALSEYQLSELERGFDIFIRGSNLRVLASTVNNRNEDNIELVPEKAKAGYATGFADPEYISELPRFTLPFLSNKRKYRTFQLNGDSMLPIPHGAWVTGEFVQDWETIINGQGYIVFTIDDGIVFKIAEKLHELPGTLRLHSLNPLYDPFDVHVSAIREIWKFVHFISHELPEPVPPTEELYRTMTALKKDVNAIRKKLLN